MQDYKLFALTENLDDKSHILYEKVYAINKKIKKKIIKPVEIFF